MTRTQKSEWPETDSFVFKFPTLTFKNIITINFLRNCVTISRSYCSAAKCWTRAAAGTHAVFTQPGVSDKEMTGLVAVGLFSSAELSFRAPIICDMNPFLSITVLISAREQVKLPVLLESPFTSGSPTVIASLLALPSCLLHQRRHIISAGGGLDITSFWGGA